MAKHRNPYPEEFREKLVALVRAGRTPDELAAEFEPTAQSIRNWVAQADRDGGRRKDGLTTEEREELRRLRLEGPRGPRRGAARGARRSAPRREAHAQA